MSFVKALVRIVIGLVFGFGAAIALSPGFAAFAHYQDAITPLLLPGIVLLAGVLGFFAPTIRRAFGRGFLLLGVSVFALPISTFLLSGRVASESIAAAGEGSEAFSALGAGLAGAAVTGFAAFIGTILGVICLIIGLVLSLGGRREVVVVESPRRELEY
ncbi:hypothetical protein [Roseibium sp. RKSG952]|uniref:hypothetical protein n=1 Tax=Roseibium sp. RKSG952 TaxID=2529384 RepID=UPI0012BB64DB|nr:hypothetical protein [Roseibium sp. RKSG952]MTH96425.1 hypothetical protein [Roseibium sp. RKSG952]